MTRERLIVETISSLNFSYILLLAFSLILIIFLQGSESDENNEAQRLKKIIFGFIRFQKVLNSFLMPVRRHASYASSLSLSNAERYV